MPTQAQDEASFGKYNCSNCGNSWKSTESFANTGQKCYKCKSVVLPTKQRPMKKTRHALHKKTKQERHLEGAGPFFGEFSCKKCAKHWCSAFSWFDEDEKTKMPQRCKSCKSNVFAVKMRPLEKVEKESTKPHQVHLCGKCKKLGYSCEQLKIERMSSRFAGWRI